MKLIFAGTPEFARASLAALLADTKHEIVAVYTQPDRPAGRGQKLTASPVKQLALAHGIPVLQPTHLKDQDTQQQLAALNADLMIVVAFGLLLPQAVLAIPRLGCLNVHASLLPRWRGAAPIQRAIEAGDRETGITIMQMDVGLDTGAICLQRSLPITETDSGQTLHDRLAQLGAESLLAALSQLETTGSLPQQAQDSALACYAQRLTKQEALLDWQQPASVLCQKVRALNPWPVSYCQVAGVSLRIWMAEPLTERSDAPAGMVLDVRKKGLVVAVASGESVCVTALQWPGKTVLQGADILNARHPFLQVGVLLKA